MAQKRILIVDDDAVTRFGLREFLSGKGYGVDEADSLAACRSSFQVASSDLLLLDYLLPDGNAIDLLPWVKEIDPRALVVVLTAHASIDLAVRAIKEGADHFLTKPIDFGALAVIVQRLLENQRHRQQQLATRSRTTRPIDPFAGTSPAIRQLEDQARRVLHSESPVLIQGETGSGKGVLARWLHDHGTRSEEPWIDLNCAGLSPEFLESELFGHEKGAFTGAAGAKMGLLELANGGTVFLDEVGDMDVQVQPKLLKVLEDKTFRRMGDVRNRRVDIRLIAATHADLRERAEEKAFRSDLYFRISALPLQVPPLRRRSQDIPLLARLLLADLAQDLGRARVGLSGDCDRALLAYSWPGNVRELRNVLERAVLLSDRDELAPEHFRFDHAHEPRQAPPAGDLTLQEMERRHIKQVLESENGHVERAAQRLGIPRSTLYQRLRRYGMATPRA